MALRVLLADESSTIKKVFQLALQDYAVDVCPVNVGVDVQAVAQKFKPDIIFADVLLQKKNGYDVAAELKQDPTLQSIPIVLMWSGFMELDEDKLQASHADGQLEKPFDVAALRKLVAELVPRTKDQRISQFLTFPKMPDIEEKKTVVQPEPEPASKSEEDFQQVPIPKMKGSNDKFRVHLKPEELSPEAMPVDFSESQDGSDVLETQSQGVDDLLASGETDEFSIRDSSVRSPQGLSNRASIPPTPPIDASDELDVDFSDHSSEQQLDTPGARGNVSSMTTGALTEAQLEKIIRSQSAEIIESVVWKVIPDLASQIIERELQKLLKEKEANPY